jgi:hypothetical protein
MLLPSALPCESRKYRNRSNLISCHQFSPTPPRSDDGSPVGNGLLGTCRALQSLLNASPVSSPRCPKPERLQSPLQMRPIPARRPQKVVKPTPKPPRGLHKRTRSLFEAESDGEDSESTDHRPRDAFSTPKRRKRAPSDVPLGLALTDFESLESTVRRTSPPSPSPSRSPVTITRHRNLFEGIKEAVLPSIEISTSSSSSSSGAVAASSPHSHHSSWTSEDDQKLVEIVLEKLKLSKTDWEECARQIGKDNDSVGRRWQALVGEGNIGLRRGRRFVRGRINENWM